MTYPASVLSEARSVAAAWGTSARGMRYREQFAASHETCALIADRQRCPELAAAYREAAVIFRNA